MGPGQRGAGQGRGVGGGLPRAGNQGMGLARQVWRESAAARLHCRGLFETLTAAPAACNSNFFMFIIRVDERVSQEGHGAPPSSASGCPSGGQAAGARGKLVGGAGTSCPAARCRVAFGRAAVGDPALRTSGRCHACTCPGVQATRPVRRLCRFTATEAAPPPGHAETSGVNVSSK